MDIDGDQRAYYDATAGRPNSLASCLGTTHLMNFLRAASGPSVSVLDVGCGNGAWLGFLAAHFGRVTALDYAPRRVSRLRERFGPQQLSIIEANILDYRIPRHVDIVLMSYILSHLPADEASEVVHRAVDSRPEGRGVAMVDHGVGAYNEVWEVGLRPDEPIAIRDHGHRVLKRFGAVRQLAVSLLPSGNYVEHRHCQALTVGPLIAG